MATASGQLRVPKSKHRSSIEHQNRRHHRAIKPLVVPTPSVIFLVIAVAALQIYAHAAGASSGSANSNKLTISSSGINVPKRPALIAGLNQQFKSRQNASTNPLAAILPGSASASAGQTSATASGVGGLLAAVRFGPRPRPAPGSSSSLSSSTQSGSNAGPTAAAALSGSTGNLYLDRHQQELLAANPDPNLPATNLLTRSDVPASVAQSAPSSSSSGDHQRQMGAASLVAGGSTSNLVQRLLAQASPQNAAANQANELAAAAAETNLSQSAPKDQVKQQQQADQPQQSYRGYSLIELEVKSELDRRYVQDLYGNLSAALNEQAQRPQSFSVSPYVDIDFWSFKTALNDQIDIMVSPKSRAFILGQLSRARIKHRVKIDDIQARLDQQQQQQQPQQPANGGQLSGANQALNANFNYELSGRQSASDPQAASAAARSKSKLDSELNGRQQGGQSSSSSSLVSSSGSANDSLFFDNYQRLADINQYLESIVARARDVAKVQVIGRSSQGRYLRVLRLGYEQHDLDGSTGPLMSDGDAGAELGHSADELAARQQLAPQPPRPMNASNIMENFFKRHQSVKKLGSLWLDGGTHAREWISPATVLYIAFRLSDNHAKCLRFFDYLRMVVNQQQQQQRSARGAPPPSSQLESDLLEGINEINSSLMGGQKVVKLRSRSELEQKLELLAKRPQEVASEHGCDLELEQLLRRYTFYIMPVLNPDGYEYSHTHNRLWRKTRSTSNHPIYRHFCLGADPNRNYDARHGSTGSSSHPCSQTYGGTTPFTEPETRHQSNFVYAHRDSLKMFISFHSYSQMILLPYSHSKQLAPDHKDLESVGQAAVRAIEKTHGTQYKVGPSASILYTASGTASDWAYEKAGIKYSYTIELRDTGNFGFLLPRQQIIPTGEETFNGLLAMIQQMELNDNLLLLSAKQHSNSINGKQQWLPDGAGESQPQSDYNSTSASQLAQLGGLVHAPDLDQLRPFGRFRPRPAQLENAIDGSDTWATPQPRAPGVRDRKPLDGNQEPTGPAVASADEFDSANRIIEDEVVSMAEEEPDAGLAFEGEGELMEPTNNLSVNSALNGQSSDAAAQSAAKLMGHIYAHSSDLTSQQHQHQQRHHQLAAADNLQARHSHQANSAAMNIRQRIHSNQHQLGLSANGRSLINSPPGPTRTTASMNPRRESSNNFQ